MAEDGAYMKRRRFTTEQKQSLIAEIDSGADVKALLAREGITHSHIASFRKATKTGATKTIAASTVAEVVSFDKVLLKRLDNLEECINKLAQAEPNKQLLEIQTQLDKITEAVTKK
jgi:transposase-like protein